MKCKLLISLFIVMVFIGKGMSQYQYELEDTSGKYTVYFYYILKKFLIIN